MNFLVSSRSLALSLVASLALGCGSAEPRNPVDPPRDGGFIPLPDGGTVACRGNRDGVISRDELVFAPGVEVRYLVNPLGTAARVSVAGTAQSGGVRVWDFSDPAGDTVPLALQTVSESWYAPTFPGAQYAARLDPRSPLLGVYRASDTSVALLGAVGADEATGTRIRYDTPIDLLRFPLRMGLTWIAEGTTVDSEVEHTPVASRDRYEVTVDAIGEIRLRYVTITQALRLRVEVTQRFPAGPGNRKIQYLWLTECYGEVARATSRDGEVNPDFTEAAVFRRLGL